MLPENVGGLAALAAAFGAQLDKRKMITLSDWEARPLCELQCRYAAADAFAGLWIAQRLHELRVLAPAHLSLRTQARQRKATG